MNRLLKRLKAKRVKKEKKEPKVQRVKLLQMVETEKQKIRREYERKESQVEVKKKMCVRDRSTIPRANDRSDP